MVALWVLGSGWACTPTAPPAPVAATAPANETWLTPQQVSQARIVVRPVAMQSISAPVTCAGKLAFDDERVVHVVAPVSGRITRIMAPVGSHVAQGAPLCAISSAELAQTVAQAQEAHADLLTAQRAYARLSTLYAGHAAAQKDFEAARTGFVQAQAEYERAHQKSVLLGGTQKIVGDTYVLRAPLEGNVVASTAHPGSEVQGQYDAGANVADLFVVGALDSVWAQADVFEMDIQHVDLGDAVTVSVVAYPGETFAGKVDFIAGTIDPKTRAVRVRSRLDNSGHRLRPDMFVTMKLRSDKGHQLTVPRRGVFRYQGHTVVFVQLPQAKNEQAVRFERRTVKAQEEAWGDDVPILAGLAQGELVVAEGGIVLLGE